MLETLYLLALFGLAVYGCVGLVTLALFLRHLPRAEPTPSIAENDLPPVTVQLPVYNERFVVERLIDAVARLDYPADRLQIQVLDDSTDDTTPAATVRVGRWHAAGVNITHHHRTHRQGYKAGALAAGLATATGRIIAVFDADFVPAPDFLRRTVPHFCVDPSLGVLQTRWGHLNPDASPLTAMQAVALDKHFATDQLVRHRANLFPKFNGSAGLWRRTCLDDAGGWQFDTVTEDLCLSTRAVIRGWKFHFLPDVVAPAELPDTISAFKNQQARWAKGTLQCLIKYGGQVARARTQTVAARLYALLTFAAYFSYPLAVFLLLLQLPFVLLDIRPTLNPYFFTVAGLGQPLLFALAQLILYPDGWKRLRHLPSTLIIAVGIGASQSRALGSVLAGRWLGIEHVFVRTPKGRLGQKLYHLGHDWIVAVELGLALYAAGTMALAAAVGRTDVLPLLASGLLGYGYVAYLTLRER